MEKILIVEGLCAWNVFVKKMLVAEGYRIQTVRSLDAVWQSLDHFKPDLVLVGMGVSPDQAWHVLRRLKVHDVSLPVLVYQVVNGQGVEDFKRVVSAALQETSQRNKECREKQYDHSSMRLVG